MGLNFKVYARTERKELGTILELVGKGGTVAPIAKNLRDESKRVTLVLTNKKGESDTVVLSTAVSKLFRSKEIKLSQVIGLTVIEQELPNGEIMNVVVMPSREGTTLTHFAVDKMKVTSFDVEEREAVSLEDLIAL